MKRVRYYACLLMIGLSAQFTNAQVVNPGNVAKDDATNRANNNIYSGVDKGAGKVEDGIKGLFKKKKKTDTTAKAAAPTTQPAIQPVLNNQVPVAQTNTAGFKTYSNYDFVPGDTVLFEDHFTDDQDGEFPSHWDLKNGQAVLNKMDDNLAFLLTDGNYCKVLPLIKSPSYLTDNFTVEYDIYANDSYPLQLWFYRKPNSFDNDNFSVRVDGAGCAYKVGGSNDGLTADLPADISHNNFSNKWHHIAIAYKKQQLKVYVDQYRVLVVPRTVLPPVHLDIESIGDQKKPVVFKNFRIANGGGMNMLGKKFTDAKIITHGINFDIDKATIKPESMGTLNMVVSVLKDNPDIQFEIDGHTDNSGTAPHNLALSQQRADAVKTQLVAMGIDATRLTTKGFGDTKPISDNLTIEGKANNRRVEFIKM